MTCGILVSQLGIKPQPLHWKHRVLTAKLPGESLRDFKLHTENPICSNCSHQEAHFQHSLISIILPPCHQFILFKALITLMLITLGFSQVNYQTLFFYLNETTYSAALFLFFEEFKYQSLWRNSGEGNGIPL